MKFQVIFLSFLTIINSALNKGSEKTDSLVEILKKEYWTISANRSPFKPNNLEVTDSSDPLNIRVQTYPVLSQEEVKTIEPFLNQSFRDFPVAHSECLRSILTGQIGDERLRVTPLIVTIQDKENKKFRVSHVRKSFPIFPEK